MARVKSLNCQAPSAELEDICPCVRGQIEN